MGYFSRTVYARSVWVWPLLMVCNWSIIANAQSLGIAQQSFTPLSIESMELAGERLAITIDPSVGGRISSLSYKDRQLLFSKQEAQDSNNWGSTFWLSPQKLWGWPPIKQHDSAPYQVSEMHEDSITLVSDWAMGARVKKRMSIDAEYGNVLQMDYLIDANESFEELAGWEITRVPRRGLVFYPASESSLDVVMGAVSYRHNAEVVWFDLKPDVKPPEGKINANGGEGWLAWVEDDLLYLKLYQPVAAEQMASGEGDVEVYFSPRLDYIELEVQSAAQALERGDQLQWRVTWLVEEVPSDISIAVGSKPLLAWVRHQAQQLRKSR